MDAATRRFYELLSDVTPDGWVKINVGGRISSGVIATLTEDYVTVIDPNPVWPGEERPTTIRLASISALH